MPVLSSGFFRKDCRRGELHPKERKLSFAMGKSVAATGHYNIWATETFFFFSFWGGGDFMLDGNQTSVTFSMLMQGLAGA